MCFLLGVSVWAVDANEFLIGAYSQYQIRYAGNNYAANFDSLGVYLNNAGYNATVYGLTSGYSDRLSTIFQKLHESDIKSMLFDNTWSPTANKVGISSLTFGNRLQIEAEYQLLTSTSGSFVIDDLSTENESVCMESFDYVTQHETGDCIANNPSDNISYSNSYAWICDSSQGHMAGKAMFNPRRRWKPSGVEWPSGLSKDIVLLNFIETPIINDNKLYLTVALRFENIPNGTPVADISLKLYNPPNSATYSEYENYVLTDSSNYVNVTLTPVDSLYGTSIIAQTYPSAMKDSYGNYIFEYFVNLSTLTSYMKGSTYSFTREFYHINPEVYWYGNGKIIIDYITIEDDFNRSVRTNSNSPYVSQIDSQINYITTNDTSNNLLYLMSMDEPRAGQLQIYKHMQNHLNSINPTRKMVTATNLKDYGLIKHDSTPYNYPKRFLYEATPDRIMVDVFPLKGNIVWNGSSQTVQSKIDSKIHYYYYSLVKDVQQSNNPDTEIFYIPQTFGIVLQNSDNWSYNMPPLSMLKVLKYLPLCYAADGMVDFCVASNPTQLLENGYWVTPLSQDQDGGNFTDQYNNLRITDNVSAYKMLAEANSKIAQYGPKIRQLNWLNANKLMTTGVEPTPALNNADQINLNSVLLDNLVVEAEEDNTGYTGFVQCGYYNDNQGIPYFMLVNRRAVYKRTGNDVPANGTPVRYVDYFFRDASSQTVCFEPNNSSHNIFGTHVALYDAYDNSVFQTDSGVINVEIGPGDGRLLQMCSSLPSTVTSNSVVKNVAYLSGSITIGTGTSVTIQAGTRTTIFPYTTIHVNSGATLNISGELTIADNVSFIVEEGGQISFDDAICTWGQGSFIEVNGGSLTINGGSMDKTDDSTTWAGIRVTGSDWVYISDAIISNAHYHQVSNSNLLISNSSFNMPANSWGLLLQNSITGYQTEIINTEPNCGFYGDSNLTSYGIKLGQMKNPVYISNVDFKNLLYGIRKSVIPCATDSVSECHFVNCYNGIELFDNENATNIQQCIFSNHQTGKQGTGIYLVASSPTISACNFSNLNRGILTEFTLVSNSNSSVNESNFHNCEMGMESRGSNHRLKENYFNRNNSGIVNHAGSNLNLSFDANNVMMNHNANIVFYDTEPYESTIQLFKGHNDFYHLTDNSTGLSAIDFSFDTNYYNFPVTIDFKINASKNWFQANQVTFNDPAYSDYVYVNLYDPSPSMPAPPPEPPENERLFLALSYESQELYELAGTTYKAIIDDQLEEEQSYVTSAIDGLYRCTMMIPNPAWELTDYFDTKALQYAIDYPPLSAILKDYLAKVFVLNKDFQAAVDLIQLRIDNPISEIDSLRAVLDLEIVLQLAAMEEDKRPITTKYVQYQYPDIQVFNVMHSNNWDKYNRVLHQNDPENMFVVAPIPQIQSNYPNPFNASTTIAFSIPETGQVRVSVYNIKGQKVKELINTEMASGIHRLVWNGKDTNSRDVGSGIYFFKLESGGNTSIRKAMLMK
jgi:hypothetical protein